MRIVHMDSGLGNQMLDYAEYLAIEKTNPDTINYLETIIYDIPPKAGMFSQWNGYELNRIFGIEVPNIKSLFSEDAWDRIIKKVSESHFWEDNWNYAPSIVRAINEEGYQIENLQPDRGHRQDKDKRLREEIRKQVTRFFDTQVGFYIKWILRRTLKKRLIESMNKKCNVYQRYNDNTFIGHSFAFKYKGFGIERIDKEIRDAFQFPPITDKENLDMLSIIHAVESVSIHVRRSDALFIVDYCYKHGFFKRAIRFIKKYVKNPEFFFFCDPYSIEWCKKNDRIFGLDFNKDKVHFIDWNKEENSFRDMQLMAECKHNVFTDSTFGFWGAYLNNNPSKITCAPDVTILSTHTF